MKKSVYTILFVLNILPGIAQETPPASPKVKWFLGPEYSSMFLENHVGHALGFQAGISIWKEKLQLAFYYYGRSGPINGHTELLRLPEGSTYKGQNELELGVDHAAFGLSISPQFSLFQDRIRLETPLQFGQIGAGFYLKGDKRKTPDGRRVSEWENELMNKMDAGFGMHLEFGARIKFRISKKEQHFAGLGLHYALAPGWETYVGGSDYYNAPRASFFLQFGN